MSRPGARSLHPRFKLWLSTDTAEGVFGDGKYRLLRAIASGGSLRAAATTLAISYRKAWGDLRKAERHLGVPLVERSRGGCTGGSARVTEAGRAWLAAYAAFRAELEQSAANAFARHMRPVAAKTPSAATR